MLAQTGTDIMTKLVSLDRKDATLIRPVDCTFGDDYTPVKGFETNSPELPDVVAFLSIPDHDIVHLHIHSLNGEAEIQISSSQMLELMTQFTTLLTSSEPKQ